MKFNFNPEPNIEQATLTPSKAPSIPQPSPPKRPRVPEKLKNVGFHHAQSLLGKLEGEIEIKDGDESISMLSESSLDGLSEAFEGMSIFIDDYIMVEAAEVAPVRPCGAWTCIVKREWGDTEGNR